MKQPWSGIHPVLEGVERLLTRGAAPERLVGLDVSGYQIKMAIVQRRRGNLCLEAFSVEKVDADSFEDEEHFWQHQRMLLASLVEEHDLAEEKTIVVLPFTMFTRREIILPKMPRQELRKAILFETRKFADRKVDEVVVDYVTLNEFDQEGVKYGSHLVILIDRAALDKMLGRLDELELNVIGFGVVPLALRNTLAAMRGHESGSIRSVLDVGKEEVSFSLFRDDELIFTRDIPGGGHALTQALTSIVVSDDTTVELDYRHAEAIKIKYGITDAANAEGATDDGIPLSKINVMMRPVLERMLIEIQRSIEFCQEQYRLAPPAIMYLSGGGSRLKNFGEFLRARLHMDVEFLDPLESLTWDASVDEDLLRERTQDLVTAIGLAMNVGRKRFYFAPEEYRRRDYRFARHAMRFVAGVSAFAALSAFGTASYRYSHATRTLEQKRATLQNLQTFQQQHRAEAETIRVQKFKRQTLLNLLGPDVPWGSVLKELSNRVPADIQLTEVRVVTRSPDSESEPIRRVEFRGLLFTENTRPEISIARLLSNLNDSPYFRDVQLVNVKTVKKDIAAIDFNCKLVY